MRATLDVCDRCGRPPNGDSPDHITFYHPCGHAVCNECNYRTRTPGVCLVCGTGRDAYTREGSR